jgi:signal transduction histidine kinase
MSARPRGWRSWAFDAAVAASAVLLELGALYEADSTPDGAAIACAVAAGAALVLRRVWPLAVLAVTLSLSFPIIELDETPALATLIALFTVASRMERRVSLSALAATAVVVATLTVVTGAAGDAIGNVLFTAGVWGFGAYIQTRRRYQAAVATRAEQLEREQEQSARIAVIEERAAIARELHDIVAHSVAVMLMGVRGARDVLRRDLDVADETLARVETTGEQSLAELRRILALLRERDAGAESRPQPSLADLEDLVAEYRDAGLPVRMEIVGEPPPLDSGVELSVYRIVQEALTNVLKHSRPTEVTVSLVFRAGRLEVEVVDDGAPAAASHGSGQGLVGMRERVALLGGELEAGRRTGGGFRVAASVPLGSER